MKYSRGWETTGHGEKTSCVFKESTVSVTDQRSSLAGRPDYVPHCETWHPARTSSIRHHISVPFSAPWNPLVGSRVLPLTHFKCGPFALKSWGKKQGLRENLLIACSGSFSAIKLKVCFSSQWEIKSSSDPSCICPFHPTEWKALFVSKQNDKWNLRRPRRST